MTEATECPAGDGTGDHESQFFEWPGRGEHWRCLRCGEHLCKGVRHHRAGDWPLADDDKKRHWLTLGMRVRP